MRMVRVVDTRVLLWCGQNNLAFRPDNDVSVFEALDDGGFNGDHAILELSLFGQTRLGQILGASGDNVSNPQLQWPQLQGNDFRGC